MKKSPTVLLAAFLFSSSAWALQMPEEPVDLQATIDNMNAVKPEQYVEITKDINTNAGMLQKNLSKKEINMLVKSQNYINKKVAEKRGEEAPEEIVVDPEDSKEVQKFLTPDVYTYDD